MVETKKDKSTAMKEIKTALTQVRKSEADMHELAMLLEKEVGNHVDGTRLNRLALGNRAKDSVKLEELYKTFYSAYTIRLLEEYVDILRDRLLLFAIYGILPGYRNLKLKERREKYAQDNPNVKFDRAKTTVSGWSDPNSSLPDYEDDIIESVAKQLVAKTDCLNEKLGLSTIIFDELEKIFPNGLPEELPSDFPKCIALSKSVSKDILDLPSMPEDVTIEESQHSEDDGTSIDETYEQIPTVSILLNTQIKLRIIACIERAIIVIIISILIVTGLHMTISRNKNLEQIQHTGVTYSEIQQEEASTENALLNKPIFKKISVHDENDKRVEHIEILAGESSILVVHFSPGNADKDKLNITSSDTGLLNVGVLDAGMSGKLPFLAEAEEKWDAENYKTSILAQGQGAIPACVNVTIAQNIPKQYNNDDMQNGGTLESGGLKNEGQK